MLVQLRAFSWRHIHQNHTDAGVAVEIPLELIGLPIMGEIIPVDDGIVHACLLRGWLQLRRGRPCPWYLISNHVRRATYAVSAR
jgi:hypothetical protein